MWPSLRAWIIAVLPRSKALVRGQGVPHRRHLRQYSPSRRQGHGTRGQRSVEDGACLAAGRDGARMLAEASLLMPAIGRQFFAKVLQFLLVNCAVFAAYRVSFIRLFGVPEALSGAPAALLRGLGLDAALLALELCVLALLALVTRRLRLRATLGGLWVFTCVNALCAAVNLFVFRERHQHLWEIVPAKIGRPYETLIAFAPFTTATPFVVGAGLLGIALAAL